MVRTNCAVYGCYATSKNNKELKFHRFPQDERVQSWIAACQRPDLKNKTAKQLYNMHVCGLHFEKWMYINKKLKDAALPTLNLPAANSVEEIGAQSIEIAEDSIREVKTENESPTDSAGPSTSPKLEPKKPRRKPLFRMTNQSREVVFNIHQYYQKRKFDPTTWEYEVDLSIHKHVAKIIGFSDKTVQRIVRDFKALKPNVNMETNEPSNYQPTVKHEDNIGPSSSSATDDKLRNSTINIVVTKANYEKEQSDDSEPPAPEVPVTVKIEVKEEEISEHEEDMMEKIENRKRMQENDLLAAEAKKIRVEVIPVTESKDQKQSEAHYVGYLAQQHTCAPQPMPVQEKQQPEPSEPLAVPEFFMNVVVRNQNEILKILKRQVLLQDPDPELLTFLRFLGSKLLRFPKKKRDELQDKISEMLLLE